MFSKVTFFGSMFHHSSHALYIRLALRTPSSTVSLLHEPMRSAMRLSLWPGQESLYTLVSISFSFSTIPFFSYQFVHQKRRPLGTPIVAVLCSFSTAIWNWNIPPAERENVFRLLIVFSAGNLLVNQRGRVWGGENRKFLLSYFPSEDRLSPWCQVYLSFSGLFPFPIQFQCFDDSLLNLFLRSPGRKIFFQLTLRNFPFFYLIGLFL